MPNSVEQNTHPAMHWSKFFASVVEDAASGVIGFASNGLNHVYNGILKRLPLVGGVLSQPWIEQVLKLCTGITIGQGLARDLGYYIFRPVGFVIGFLVGNSGLKNLKKIPTYKGQIGKVLNALSGPTIGGVLLGLGAFAGLTYYFAEWIAPLDWLALLIICVSAGALAGLVGKAMLLYAIHFVTKSQRAAVEANTVLARELGTNLKTAAKQQAKGRILMQAQDIIQQVNGAVSQQYLEVFFKEQYEQIAATTTKQIDRHFNYLVDRACHGDDKALQKLQRLNPSERAKGQNAFEVMLDRMFNKRAILKIKDEVDTVFDRWQYRHLRA
jgi:hypothetical protein